MAAGTNMTLHDDNEARRQRTTLSKGNQSTMPLYKSNNNHLGEGENPQPASFVNYKLKHKPNIYMF